MINHVAESPKVKFKSAVSDHELKVTVLSHLYGEAERMAKKSVGDAEPSTIQVYEFFRQRVADHLALLHDQLSEETVFFLVPEFTRALEDLKKTCCE